MPVGDLEESLRHMSSGLLFRLQYADVGEDIFKGL